MKVILVRGIGESLINNMCSRVARLLPRGTRIVELAWSASYGPVPMPLGDAFVISTAAAVPMLRAELDKEPAVVIAYSGGCVPAGAVAASAHPNLLATVLIADPFQPRDVDSSGTGGAWKLADRFGIAGERRIPFSHVVKWVFDPADVICQCAPNSPLRTLADQTSAVSLRSPDAWMRDLANRARTKRWQNVVVPWNNPAATWALYSEAINAAGGYLHRGDHTDYGVRRQRNGKTYLQNAADWILEVAA